MGVGTHYGDIKFLARQDIGGAYTSTDHGSSGTVETGIRPLGPPKTKLHNAVSLGRIYNTGGLGGNERLVVYNIKNGCLHQLGLHNRGNYLNQRLSGEYYSSLGNGIDVSGKMKTT